MPWPWHGSAAKGRECAPSSPATRRSASIRSTRGEKIMAFGLTEPEAGSNPLEMQMTYERRGDKFLLNGVKYLISNAGIASTVVVFAYPKEGTHRVSAFIVDLEGAGCT